jgi:Tfp pilus assembly protein PilN
VRPVNLLPENLRPRERKETGVGGYVVLGVLGALLVATVMYVVTANQITSRQAETERLKAETQAAEQRAGDLAQFGSFQEMKTTRMASVSELAEGRIDWERMARELARVLPAGVWLTELKATATGEEAAGTSSAGASSGSSSSSSGSSSGGSGSSGAAAGEEDTGPGLTLLGCAPSQESVAEAMVRLRRLHRAEDVQLVTSERGEDDETTASQPAPSAGAAPSGASTAPSATAESEGCGEKRGRPNYKFEVRVKLAPAAEAPLEGESVPSSLGGGS